MTKPSVRKKPTNKEIASAIIEINNKVNELTGGMNEPFRVLSQLDSVLGMYIEFKKDNPEFSEFLVKKQEEIKKKMEEKNDSEGNGNPDKGDISKDTGDEGSGTEGVREEK